MRHLLKSSVNKTKNLAPPSDATCMGPHTSECIIWPISVARVLPIGKGKRCILPNIHPSQGVVGVGFLVGNERPSTSCWLAIFEMVL